MKSKYTAEYPASSSDILRRSPTTRMLLWKLDSYYVNLQAVSEGMGCVQWFCSEWVLDWQEKTIVLVASCSMLYALMHRSKYSVEIWCECMTWSMMFPCKESGLALWSQARCVYLHLLSLGILRSGDLPSAPGASLWQSFGQFGRWSKPLLRRGPCHGCDSAAKP